MRRGVFNLLVLDSVNHLTAETPPAYTLLEDEDRLKVEHPDCEHDIPPEMREASCKLFDKVLGVK